MRKLAFVFGYAGAILALIVVFFMILSVPVGILSDLSEDILDDFENENIIAMNEIGLAIQQQGVSDVSEDAMMAFAQEVSENSPVYNDPEVYEDTMALLYKHGVHFVVSMAVVALTVVFALMAFIGALTCRKASAGGILMLMAALETLLAAIYTGMLMPLGIASLLLAIGGVVVFIPVSSKNRRMAPQAHDGYYQQVPYETQPQYSETQHVQPAQPQYTEPPQTVPIPAAEPELPAISDVPDTGGDVPFPDDDSQVYAQPADGDAIKE